MARDASSNNRPKKKRHILRKIFASVATVGVLGAAGLGLGKAWERAHPDYASSPDPQPTYVQPPEPSSAEPDTFEMFGMMATQTPLDTLGPVNDAWSGMLQRQEALMKDPAEAQRYNDYLKKFEVYKGLPLDQMAVAVNGDELRDIPYNDYVNCRIPDTRGEDCSGKDFLWLSADETLKTSSGNCIDQAILMYYVMRHLDVPANRLFIVGVSATGSGGPNHAVLLLNTAPDGQEPTYLVMSNNDPVVPADNGVIGKTWSFGFMPADFVPYYAVNEDSAWYVPEAFQQYGAASAQAQQLPAAAALPVPAKRSFNMRLG